MMRNKLLTEFYCIYQLIYQTPFPNASLNLFYKQGKQYLIFGMKKICYIDIGLYIYLIE